MSKVGEIIIDGNELLARMIEAAFEIPKPTPEMLQHWENDKHTEMLHGMQRAAGAAVEYLLEQMRAEGSGIEQAELVRMSRKEMQ